VFWHLTNNVSGEYSDWQNSKLMVKNTHYLIGQVYAPNAKHGSTTRRTERRPAATNLRCHIISKVCAYVLKSDSVENNLQIHPASLSRCRD